MRALARGGFLVMAPNHADNADSCPSRLPAEFMELPPDFWGQLVMGGEGFYKERGQDIRDLWTALQADAVFSLLIDRDRVALVGPEFAVSGHTAKFIFHTKGLRCAGRVPTFARIYLCGVGFSLIPQGVTKRHVCLRTANSGRALAGRVHGAGARRSLAGLEDGRDRRGSGASAHCPAVR